MKERFQLLSDHSLEAFDRLFDWIKRWLQHTSEGLSSWWRTNTERRHTLTRALVRAAELVGWAPTALVMAALGAMLTSVSVTWLVAKSWDFSDDTAKVLLAVLGGIAFLSLMFWFATSPRVVATSRRFWAYVRLVVVMLGLVSLYIAVDHAVGYVR